MKRIIIALTVLLMGFLCFTGLSFGQPSLWPIIGSVALLLMAVGGTMTMREIDNGVWVLLAGIATLFYMMFGWFGEVIRDSEAGRYNKQVDASFRWSMSWFIFSEVMFFAAFFGALFYTRVLSVPWLSEGDTMQQLWPTFKAAWPTAGPGLTADGIQFTPMGAWGIPAIKTLLLLTSGVTVTWAHWGLKKNNRPQLILGLAMTVALGAVFLGFQVYEYIHAYSEMGLTLGAGVYGATFFMLTGFHGFHVLVGTTMLLVMLLRSIAGHFTADHHFAFEAVSWYWHFVDVVWVLLFIVAGDDARHPRQVCRHRKTGLGARSRGAISGRAGDERRRGRRSPSRSWTGMGWIRPW